MTEHFITLSTTEPNNNIGIVKLRHADVNSQAIVAQIVENGQPKSFEGLQPFFCLMAQETTGQGLSEESVVSFDAKNGTLNYIASDNALQMVGQMKLILALENKKAGGGLSNFRHVHFIILWRNLFILNHSKTLITGGLLKSFIEFLTSTLRMEKRVGNSLWKQTVKSLNQLIQEDGYLRKF